MTTRETRKLTATETKLIELLKTNTGHAMMDSGGEPQYDADGKYTGSIHGYGRAHERNQGRTFVDEPATSLHFFSWYVDKTGKEGPTTERGGDIEFTIEVFHFLNSNLVYDTQIDDFYKAFLEIKEEKDDPHLQDALDFIAWLREEGFEVGGLYGGGDDPMCVNTYNEESNLSQVLQFQLLCVETVPDRYEDQLPMAEFHIVLLQIHQGADVRGGYTAPTGFTVGDEGSPEGLLMGSDGEIYCNGCDAHWQTDDGYHWYEDGSSGGDKILDWPAQQKVSKASMALKERERELTRQIALRRGTRAMVTLNREAETKYSYALEYSVSFDVMEAFRNGDTQLAWVLWSQSPLSKYHKLYVGPGEHLASLIWQISLSLSRPQAHSALEDEWKVVEIASDAVAKRPYVQLDKCTFVTLDDIEEHDDLKQSLSEYMGNPSIPEPVPDGQATYLENDSDIRDSRNHPRNKQDTKGWAVTHGYVLIDENHNGHCPFCGYVLEGGF